MWLAPPRLADLHVTFPAPASRRATPSADLHVTLRARQIVTWRSADAARRTTDPGKSSCGDPPTHGARPPPPPVLDPGSRHCPRRNDPHAWTLPQPPPPDAGAGRR